MEMGEKAAKPAGGGDLWRGGPVEFTLDEVTDVQEAVAKAPAS